MDSIYFWYLPLHVELYNHDKMDNQNNYEFENYICTKETLMETIENYGVAYYSLCIK